MPNVFNDLHTSIFTDMLVHTYENTLISIFKRGAINLKIFED
jgi:hypothetical protein